jgi:hypothetical protein
MSQTIPVLAFIAVLALMICCCAIPFRFFRLDAIRDLNRGNAGTSALPSRSSNRDFRNWNVSRAQVSSAIRVPLPSPIVHTETG